jgi:alpha-tubulin suppressor-like RCC1 family protein
MHSKIGIGLICALSIACSAPAEGDGGETDGEGNLGTVALEVNKVPAGAQCLDVWVNGTRWAQYALTQGAATSVSLGKLPFGSTTIAASVFDLPCANIGLTQASWIADTQIVDVRLGEVQKIELELRQYLPAVATTDFLPTVTKSASGDYGYILLLADGTVVSIGDILGKAPTPVPSLTGVVDIFAGGRVFCGIKSDTTLWCWGYNGNRQVTDSASSFITTPVQIPGTGYTSVAMGRAHTCAVGSTGLKCWGANNAGQLGDNTLVDKPVPTTPAGPSFGTTRVYAGGDHTCITSGAGDTYCWGSNTYGELGDGTTTGKLQLTSLLGEGYVFLSLAQFHTCGLMPSGSVRCWGRNHNGMLGDGTTVNSLTPKTVAGVNLATHISTGTNHTCARLSNGQVACWGAGNDGQIGDGMVIQRLNPTIVPGLTGVVDIVGGTAFTVARKTDKDIVWWGYPGLGGLGDAFFPAYVPTPVSTW